MSLAHPGTALAQKKMTLAENRYEYFIAPKMVVFYNIVAGTKAGTPHQFDCIRRILQCSLISQAVMKSFRIIRRYCRKRDTTTFVRMFSPAPGAIGIKSIRMRSTYGISAMGMPKRRALWEYREGIVYKQISQIEKLLEEKLQEGERNELLHKRSPLLARQFHFL